MAVDVETGRVAMSMKRASRNVNNETVRNAREDLKDRASRAVEEMRRCRLGEVRCPAITLYANQWAKVLDPRGSSKKIVFESSENGAITPIFVARKGEEANKDDASHAAETLDADEDTNAEDAIALDAEPETDELPAVPVLRCPGCCQPALSEFRTPVGGSERPSATPPMLRSTSRTQSKSTLRTGPTARTSKPISFAIGWTMPGSRQSS